MKVYMVVNDNATLEIADECVFFKESDAQTRLEELRDKQIEYCQRVGIDDDNAYTLTVCAFDVAGSWIDI